MRARHAFRARTSHWVFWIVMALLAVARPAPSHADEPPPPDVASILARMKSGVPPSTAEQARLQQWMTEKKAGAAPANTLGVPPDVQAIQDRLRRGAMPTPAEIARLKQWGEEMQRKQGAIRTDAQRKEDELRASTPSSSPTAPPFKFLEGEWRVTQTIESTERCSDGRFVTSRSATELTGPVRIKTRTPTGGWNEKGELPETGPFDVTLEGRPGATITQRSGGIDCSGSTASSAAPPVSTVVPVVEIATGKGSRPYISMLLSSPSPDIALPEPGWSRGRPMPAEMQQMARSARFDLDAEKLRATIRSSKPAQLTTTYDYAITASGNARIKTTMTLLLRQVAPSGELDIAVLDDRGRPSKDTYEAWIPKPYLTSAKDAAIFALKPQDPSVVLHLGLAFKPGKKGKISVRLKDVSTNPGLTTNYPVKSKSSPPGLKLVAPASTSWKIDASGQTATLDGTVESAKIDVVAVEPGAFGKVYASSPDLGIEATCALNAGLGYLDVPRDEDRNHVADAWVPDGGTAPRGLRDTYDEDAIPAGQRRNGDGFTLYEEYRGFIVLKDAHATDLTFIRTDPGKKDLFVFDSKHVFADNYPAENPLQLEFHYVNVDTVDFVALDSASDEHRWVNTNTTDAFRYARQYANHYVIDRDGLSQANAVGKDTKAAPTLAKPRRLYTSVHINPEAMKYWLKRNLPDCSAQDYAAILQVETVSAIVHETAHTLGVRHHIRQPYDPRNPPRRDDLWPEWPAQFDWETNIDYGVIGCTMRYNQTPDELADAKRTCKRPAVTRLCRAGEPALYPETEMNDDVFNKKVESGWRPKLVSGPSNDCWGQVDLKNDP